MSAILESIISELVKVNSSERDAYSIIFLISFVVAVVLLFPTTRLILKNIDGILRLVFYSETNNDISTVLAKRLKSLENDIESINRSLSEKNVAHPETIQREIEAQLAKELPSLLSKKIDEIKAIDASIDKDIQESIAIAVNSYLDKYSRPELEALQKERAREIERTLRSSILDKTIEEQMRSAGRLKTVMINLFVLFNIGILLIYLFNSSNLSDRAIGAIIGLYVSLAAFIVYIYRTSNFRSSVLLSLREDSKKYFDAEDYIRRLKPGSSPTERDIEVLRLLMLNRSEREKTADHPYEVVLKGVSNTNIQLRGGKIMPAATSRKENT